MTSVAIHPLQSVSFAGRRVSTAAGYFAGTRGFLAAEVALSQAATTNTPATGGTAPNRWINGATDAGAKRIGIVAAAAGTTDAGVVGLRVNGTTWDPVTGTRTATQNEVLSADITALATNQVVWTTAYFVGAVQFELYTVSGSPVTFAASFNVMQVSPYRFGYQNVVITGMDVFIDDAGAASDYGYDIMLFDTTTTQTYSAAAFSMSIGTTQGALLNITEDDGTVANDKHQIGRYDLAVTVLGRQLTGACGLLIQTNSTASIPNGEVVTLHYRGIG